MPFLVSEGDILAVIPREVFDIFAPIAAVRIVKLPIDFPPIRIYQYWNHRMTNDPAAKFFRELVCETARSVDRSRPEARD